MEFRNLGTSGLRVSVVGLGCNNFGARLDLAATKAVIDRAIEQGITFFDTGGSETLMGQCFGARRKDIVLATKFSFPMGESEYMRGASRRYIMSAVDASLRRLQTDYIDLYQLHKKDPHTPMEETLRALDDLVRHGKVRYLGISNHDAWQVVDAHWISKTGKLETFQSCQDEYSLLVRDIEKSLTPAMKSCGMSLLPFFPLASGLLTGKFKQNEKPAAGTRYATGSSFMTRYWTDTNWKKIDALGAFAEARGHTLLELAFSWLACKPFVASVIAGATKPEQIDANIKAASWKLTADEMVEVDGLTA